MSPILVKELRQAMRRRSFTGTLLILQGLMVLVMWAMLGQGAEYRDVESSSWLFWTLLLVPVFAPAVSGAVSLAEERKLAMLETLVLTPLTPRRIVAGKWLAGFAQTLLLAGSLAPYFLLRYFLGGVDVVSEVTGFAIVLMVAALSTALAVGMAGPASNGRGRTAVLLGVAVILVTILRDAWRWRAPAVELELEGLVRGTAMALVTLLLLLEAGTLRLAHPAQKRTAWLRVLALACLLIAWWDTRVSRPLDFTFVSLWSALVLLIVAVGSLAEPRLAIASLYAPWLGRGRPGRALGWLLAPGWPSGVAFASVLVTGWVLVATAPGPRAWRLPLLLASVLLPVMPMRRLVPGAKSWTSAYLFFHLLAALPALVAAMLWILNPHAMSGALPWLRALSPPLTLSFAPTEKGPQVLALSVAALAVAGAWTEAGRGWLQTLRFVRGSGS